MRIPSGATISYPAGWRRLHGDPGSATAALIAAGGRFRGYLNLTPRQGQEQLSSWTSFRLEHNQEEGDRRVTERSHSGSRPFRSGRAACVNDSYVTSVGSSYVEIACLVVGRRAATVVVAAAPPDDWSKVSPALERAISTLTT